LDWEFIVFSKLQHFPHKPIYHAVIMIALNRCLALSVRQKHDLQSKNDFVEGLIFNLVIQLVQSG